MKRYFTLIALCLCTLTATAHGQKPNIIFLFADDQRPDTIQAHGNQHIKTPTLDRLAGGGVSFTNNYCAGSYSGAVCVASRSMLMTGRHWHRIKDTKNWTGMPTLPELIGKAGYKTFITGKWHNGHKTVLRSFQSGKNVFMGGMSDHIKVPLVDLAAGRLINKRMGNGFSSTLFTDAAVEFIQNEKGDKPFFLYAAYTAPHDPRQPPLAYREYYYQNRPPLPPNFLPQHPFDNSHVSGTFRDENLAPWPRTKDVISNQLAEYYGLITHLDEQIGRIIDALDQSPHKDNTLVIYTADHGLAMGSHGLLGKQSVYEHSMKAPLIVRGPGIPAGKTTDAFVYILDFHQTLLRAAGASTSHDTDGHDLMPVILGTQETVRDSVFLAFKDAMRSMRVGDWKMHRYPLIDHTLLFNLKNDPHEMVDLSSKHPDIVESLTYKLKEWQKKVGDTQALKVDHPQKKEIDMRDDPRFLDKWQPEWIVKKYWPAGQERSWRGHGRGHGHGKKK